MKTNRMSRAAGALFLLSAAAACSPSSGSADAGASAKKRQQSFPVLAWSVQETAWVQVLRADGSSGDRLDMGAYFQPYGFYPDRDLAVVWTNDVLKMVHLGDGRVERYVQREGARMGATMGEEDGSRVVAFFHSSPDGGAPETTLVETRIAADGVATNGTTLSVGTAEVEYNPVFIRGAQVLFAHGYWSPPADAQTPDHREVKLADLDAQTVKVVFVPDRAQDLLWYKAHWASRTLFVTTRDHTDDGTFLNLHGFKVNMDTGVAETLADGTTIAPPNVPSNVPTADDDPWLLVDAMREIRLGRPWTEEPPSESFGRVTATQGGAWLAGRILVVRGLDGMDENTLRVINTDTRATLLEFTEPPVENGFMILSPSYVAADGSAVVVNRTYTNGSDFAGRLGDTYMDDTGLVMQGQAVSAHVMVAGGTENNPTLEMYELGGERGHITHVRTLQNTSLLREPGWSLY